MNNCIFCKNKERSAEHVFPSSFGGRLTNKNIYCEEHNSDLGIYVDTLDSQIGAINNLFGIEPDRGKAKPIKLKDSKTGEIYTRDINGSISLSITDNIPIDKIISGKPIDILTSSFEDFNKFKQKFQKEHNIKIEVLNKGEISREIMKKPLTLKISFGGKDFFKATLYLLVTFLAHYSKETLLKLNLDNIKELLLYNTELSIFDIVSLENYPSFLNDDESQVEHSIAFVKDNNILYGIVSYFNVVTYTVKIGEYIDEFENFVVYIHPLDTSLNPNNSMKKELLPIELNIEFNPALHKAKIENIINGSNPIMNKLGEKLSRFENNRQNEILKNEIKNLKSEDELLDFWKSNQQHIYNAVIFIRDNFENDNLIRNYLNILVKEESLISDDIRYKIELSNVLELFQPIIESLNLSGFINRLCLDLAKKYAQKKIREDEDVFQQIIEAILSLSYNNLHTIRKFKI
ncbi:hypothetical protein DPV83_03035 [Aggregatibacter segnis]|uniref:HNH endonuclease 5 domain-containing protein n=1 Tax=Aggregatibacter segnis TaxID=739 RepID=A0A8B2U4F5_9PAST|nr:HNH endonuclease [Aggregatibacter segnis]RDE71561.1 hypothetical protein DPV83_03035 [Aggregatibacter segnis]